MTAACVSMSAFGEAEAVADAAAAAASDVAVEAAEDAANEAAEQAVDEAAGGSVEAAVQTVDEAAESVQEAVATVEGIGEELGVADEAAGDIAGELAQDVAGEAAGEVAEAPADQAEGYSPDAMAAWLAMSQPGEHHSNLEGFVGQWDVTVQYWMAPGMPPQVNQGTSEIQWILDGRFIQENFQSLMQMDDQPQTFRGFGLTGYDNAKQQYIGIWADTMSTTVIGSTGQIDESTGGLVLISELEDPMTGEPTSMRTVFTAVGDDELLMEAFKPLGDQDFKCLEITYTRKP